jgi:hypothetical protein
VRAAGDAGRSIEPAHKLHNLHNLYNLEEASRGRHL